MIEVCADREFIERESDKKSLFYTKTKSKPLIVKLKNQRYENIFSRCENISNKTQ